MSGVRMWFSPARFPWLVDPCRKLTDFWRYTWADGQSTDSREISEGLMTEFDAGGNVVGLDNTLPRDLNTLKVESPPAVKMRIV